MNTESGCGIIWTFIKPANKSRVFKRHTPLNPLLIEGKAEDLQIRGGMGIGNGVQADKQQ